MILTLFFNIGIILLYAISNKTARSDVSGYLYQHPLDPLTSAEIRETVAIIRLAKPYIQHSETWIFNWITLKEPEKRLLLPSYLNSPHHAFDSHHSIPRKSFTVLVEKSQNIVFEVVVNLDSRKVESWKELPRGTQPTYSWDENDECEAIAKRDPGVQERCRQMGYSNMSLVVGECWGIGYEKDQPEIANAIRPVQVWFYGRNFEEDNPNAHPFDFTATVDMAVGKVVLIQNLPTHSDFNTDNRHGNVCPKKESNYDPSLRSSFRTVHPIYTTQPEGAGYQIKGNEVTWQKFKFRVGFNAREGLIINHVTYEDGDNTRPLFYRMSIGEFFVSYGDPRPPLQEKLSFDEGEWNLGMWGFDLKDIEVCHGGGEVAYLSYFVNSDNGEPVYLPNVICIYEEDVGLLWAHQTLVKGGKILHTRSQRLTVTIFINEGNYDYKFSWRFYQDATIEFNTELHGALSGNLLAVDATPARFGTVVSPQIYAIYHQHFVALRLDAEIDGNLNTVSTVDVAALPEPSGSANNPYGNGFTTHETILETAETSRTQISPLTGRSWLMKNPRKIHPYTGKPVSWKLIPYSAPPVFFKKDSPMHHRYAFSDYNVWVTKYQEDQLYPGGFYKNGSGLPEWVQEDPNADVTDTDIVLWYIYGFTHVPRVEDYPIMPVESSGFVIKPTNFFLESPALDVPPPLS